jgi:predicted ArsR family transcriptional regulator
MDQANAKTRKAMAVRKAKAPRRSQRTKKQQLLTLLRGDGCDVATLSVKLGWQPHSTRAAIAGLRKAGVEVVTEQEKGRSTLYRLAAERAPEPAAEAAQ